MEPDNSPHPNHSEHAATSIDPASFLDVTGYTDALEDVARIQDPQRRACEEVLLFLKMWRNWTPRPASILHEAFANFGWDAFDHKMWGLSKKEFHQRRQQLHHHLEKREKLFVQRRTLLTMLQRRQMKLHLAHQRQDFERSLFDAL